MSDPAAVADAAVAAGQKVAQSLGETLRGIAPGARRRRP